MTLLPTKPLLARHYSADYCHERLYKLILLTNLLENVPNYKSKKYLEQMQIIEKIELSIYNAACEKAKEKSIYASFTNQIFTDLYNCLAYKITSNLDSELTNNKDFYNNFIENKNLDELPKLTSKQIFPDRYAEIVERIEASKNSTVVLKTSAMYQCRKCGCRQMTIRNFYNRALDEGVNLKITCTNCEQEYIR